MLMPEQVPDEVAEAVMHCFHTRNAAKSAIASAINAWPGMTPVAGVAQSRMHWGTRPCIILPLPKEEKFQPYSCTRCLAATENADDICDDCAQEARDE